MDFSIICHNLRRFRNAQYKTQQQVADLAEISRGAYAKIENGDVVPKVSTLQNIARALDVKIQDLLQPVIQLHAVRFRAQKKMTSREHVITEVGRWLHDFNFLEDLLKERQSYVFREIAEALQRSTPGPDRAIEAARLAREKLGLSEKEAIRDIAGLIESAGIKLYPLPLASDGFFGLSVAESNGGPAVVVNVWDRISVERWIFSAAHELGHLLLHLDAYDISANEEEPAQEEEANIFAGYFLMPEKTFQDEWNETYGLAFVDRVLKVKRIFQVSYRSVLYRLATTTKLQNGVWVRFQTEYKKRYGRTLGKSDEPDALEPTHFQASFPEVLRAHEPESLSHSAFVEDRLSRLVRMAIEKEEISMSRAAEILRLDMEAMRDRVASWVE